MARWNTIINICTMALHSYLYIDKQPEPPSLYCPRPRSPHTLSNLGIPLTSPPLTSAINTLLAIKYSFVLSISTNHFNTVWSTVRANQLNFYFSSSMHLFFPNSIHSSHFHQTAQEHSLSFGQHLSYPMPLRRIMPLEQLFLNIDSVPVSYRHLSPLLLSTLFSSPHALYPLFTLCTTYPSHPPFVVACDPRYVRSVHHLVSHVFNRRAPHIFILTYVHS